MSQFSKKNTNSFPLLALGCLHLDYNLIFQALVVRWPVAFLSLLLFQPKFWVRHTEMNEHLVSVHQVALRAIRTDIYVNFQISVLWPFQNQKPWSYAGNTGAAISRLPLQQVGSKSWSIKKGKNLSYYFKVASFMIWHFGYCKSFTVFPVLTMWVWKLLGFCGCCWFVLFFFIVSVRE